MNTIETKPRGKTPNTAKFRGMERQFATARDGYIWFVERFLSCSPGVYVDPYSESVKAAMGKFAKYFALDLETLFESSPSLITGQSTFARLSNGWFASVNLSNVQKFDILLHMAVMAQLSFPKDWDWVVQGATAPLVSKQTTAAGRTSARAT